MVAKISLQIQLCLVSPLGSSAIHRRGATSVTVWIHTFWAGEMSAAVAGGGEPCIKWLHSAHSISPPRQLCGKVFISSIFMMEEVNA